MKLNFLQESLNWLNSIFIGEMEKNQVQNIPFLENSLMLNYILSITTPNVEEILVKLLVKILISVVLFSYTRNISKYEFLKIFIFQLANCKGHEALAVLGVFIEAGGSDNHAYDSIIDGLRDVKAQGSSAEIKAFDMSKLFPHDLDEFFRYQGGLTTPTCNEIVTWTVFKVFLYDL